MKTNETIRPHMFWFYIWTIGFSLMFFWCSLYLFEGSFDRLKLALLHSFFIALCSIVLALIFSWSLTLFREVNGYKKSVNLVIDYLFNITNSVPQIIGLLLFYFIVVQIADNTFYILFLFSIGTALVIFKEMYELMSEQIRKYWPQEFVQSALTLGVKKSVIINFEILKKKSLEYISAKLLSLFGTSIFLQTSVDYIISVGLSRNINLIEYPLTLGNLLARSESKQDILAISRSIFSPSNIPSLFFEHLLGVSIAFFIIFSLFCFYKITSEYMRYHKL